MKLVGFHFGDYNTDTKHLTWDERQAYLSLLFLYYETEAPIPLDHERTCRLIGARQENEKRAVESVLIEFFIHTPEGWRHDRCDREIERYRERCGQSARAARARWDARDMRAQCSRNAPALPEQYERNADAMRTHSERTASAMPAHSERNEDAMPEQCARIASALPAQCASNATAMPPIPIPKPIPRETPPSPPSRGAPPPLSSDDGSTKKTAKNAPEPVAGAQESPPGGQIGLSGARNGVGNGVVPVAQENGSTGLKSRSAKKRVLAPEDWQGVHIARPDDVPAEMWRDFCALRKAKNAPVTEAALFGIRREAAKVGASITQALSFMAARGHQGFIAEAWARDRGADMRIKKTTFPHTMEDFDAIDYGTGDEL